MRERVILHSDLNSFYASVEIMRNPSLRGKPVAVCGDADKRHGIVLAKSQEAKRAGVRTAMANWEALRLCPDLVMVPPDFPQYKKYSELTRLIYQRYTDQVEPFGLDECWLDVTASEKLFGDGETIAHEIRNAVREELGLTVSVGVSFNKVFAKLGSDMKKPDAVTVISQENFRRVVWPLPAGDMLFVGRATQKKLERFAIHTIGDLAHCDPAFLTEQFGKNGRMLWVFANGMDRAPVLRLEEEPEMKSVGHGVTSAKPVQSEAAVEAVLVELAQDIARKLRENRLCANGVQLCVKNELLQSVQFQKKLHLPTQSAIELAREGMGLFRLHYDWRQDVRALTLRAIDLSAEDAPVQQSLFDSPQSRVQKQALNAAIDSIRTRFGPDSVVPASSLDGDVASDHDVEQTFSMIKDRGMRGLGK